VIFDLDGVMADTEPLNFRAVQDMFDAQLIRLDEIDYVAIYGLDYYATAEYLISKYHLSETAESLMKRQELCAMRRIDLELEPAPGILHLVRELSHRGIPLGLASNSPSVYVAHVLKRLGVDEYLDTVVSRDDVNNGKPEPDPYREACARLSVDPLVSLAVEDSQVGMQAALAAGMSVALVGPHAPEPPSTRVSRYQDIHDLTGHLLV
jgi:HAD superfamily hydrolase (TIGR01509 family)